MKYTICHPRDIESTAQRLSAQLLRDGSTLSTVLEFLLSTAASNHQYTRSLARVATRIVEHLRADGSLMGTLFREELGDMSLAIFIRHFTNSLEHDNNIVSGVMPLAISAFIGDLASLGLITFSALDACVGLLLMRTQTRLDIRCLHQLLSHASARYVPEITLAYLQDCSRAVRRRADHYLQCYSLEEDELRELMTDIVTRPLDACYREEWDRRLDLDTALQASVLQSPESTSRRSPSISPDASGSSSTAPSTPSMTSSSGSSASPSPPSSISPFHGAGAKETYDRMPLASDGHSGQCKNAVSTAWIIYAPRPVRPVQFSLWV